MNIRFNIEKNQRKALAQKIGELTGSEVKYLGVPSCGYQIGAYTLDKDSILHGDDFSDEFRSALEKAGYTAKDEPEALIISMPKETLDEPTLNRVKRIIENKGTLFKAAFKSDSLEITTDDEKVSFPWFTIESNEDAFAYSTFISMLCEFARNQKRINDKPDTSDNPKYAFRCFLLRLGMIGEEYKPVRRVLLRNLTGSSAFRHARLQANCAVSQSETCGKSEGGADDAVSE